MPQNVGLWLIQATNCDTRALQLRTLASCSPVIEQWNLRTTSHSVNLWAAETGDILVSKSMSSSPGAVHPGDT